MSEEVDYDLTVIGALAPVCQVRSAWRRPADKSSSPKPKSVSAALSHCGFYPADTSIHREFDFTEYIDDYHYDFMTFNAPRQPATLICKFFQVATPTLEWLFPIGGIYLARAASKPNQPVSNGLAKGDGFHAAGGLTPLRANCFAEGGSVEMGPLRQSLRGAQDRPSAGRAQAAIIIAHSADGGVEVAGVATSTTPITRWSAPDYLTPYETLPAGYLPPSLTASTEEVRASPLDPRHAVMPGMLKEHTFKVWGIFDVAARPRAASQPTG